MHGRDRNAEGGGSHGSVLPKIIGVLLLIGLLRALIGKGRHHGGPSAWRERRREALAKLHRELHAQDVA